MKKMNQEKIYIQEMDDNELLQSLQDEVMKLPDLNIVIAGISGRFPKADSVGELEQCLFDGVDMITDNDKSRFECGLWGLPKRHGRLKDITRFDNEFFNLTLEEANQTDHQLRILYEVVYESIIDAGVNPAELRGSKTGVFIGLHANEFENELDQNEMSIKAHGYYGQQAVRIGQYFDFRGICTSFDAACASGMIAMSSAVHAINEGVIDQAIVASSTIPIKPTVNLMFQQLKMLSPTGYSRFLDASGDGYVKSEACVAIFLQRKPIALRNYCSIMAALTSADGTKPEGITYPSARGQETLIRKTNEFVGLSTNNIEYIEAHGTGTAAGDPIECEAITNVYFPTTTTNDNTLQSACKRTIGPLLIGSSKSNMGHSEAASGLCALTKVALMLENEIIYKTLNYTKPNPLIESLIEGKLKVVDETTKLRAKIVPLSCYGFGGANAHTIVRANERPAIEFGKNLQFEQSYLNPRLIVMFGRNEASINTFFDSMLDEQSRNTRNCMSDDFISLIDNLNSAKIDRMMEYRGYMLVDRRVGVKKRDLARKIQVCKLKKAQPSCDEAMSTVHVQDSIPRACNLILSGLNSQWAKMAAGLTLYKPFWSTIERLAVTLKQLDTDIDLEDLLTLANCKQLNMSVRNQFVSIVAYQIALVNIVRDYLKVNNLTSVVGHSIGEIACAYAVGLLDENESILVAYQLGVTLDNNKDVIEKGRMVALSVSESYAAELISDYKTLKVSCVNGPDSVTISGNDAEITSFCLSMQTTQPALHINPIESCSIPLHNEKIMDAKVKQLLTDSLAEIFDSKRENVSKFKFGWMSSNCTKSNSRLITSVDAEYFANCLCTKVDFLDALQQLDDDSIALELGPSGIFESQIRQLQQESDNDLNLIGESKFHYVKLTNRSTSSAEQVSSLLEGFGRLYLAGVTFRDLTQLHLMASDQELLPNTIIYPVRRQTPSISSLFKWKHENSLFVARYPANFSTSSSKSTFSIDILNDNYKYITDHKIDGKVIYPATGYLLIAWRVFSMINKTSFQNNLNEVDHSLLPVEFRDVHLLRATVLDVGQCTIEVQFDRSSGFFQLTEGGTLVVQAFARSPTDKRMLLKQFVTSIREENLNVEALNSNDIYKQLRLNGYDYGNCFQNIISSSLDARHSRLKYNKNFPAFADSIIQTLLLSDTNYVASGKLILPTLIEYARFEPEEILSKVKSVIFNQVDYLSDTESKEINETSKLISSLDTKQINNSIIFETFCDPVTGIIVTDGIEIHGIRATPAPRRLDNNQILYESYQFVKDIEDPIENNNLDKLLLRSEKYVKICDTMSICLLTRLYGIKYNQIDDWKCNLKNFARYLDRKTCRFDEEYLKVYLKSIYCQSNEEDEYNINSNGYCILMSTLDRLLKEISADEMRRDVLLDCQKDLMQDLIRQSFFTEVMARSQLETVVENVCMEKLELKILEINSSYSLFHRPIINLIQQIEPSLSIKYLLAHADMNWCKDYKLKNETGKEEQFEIYDLENLQLKLEKRLLPNLIVYKDISCDQVSTRSTNDSNSVPRVIDYLAKTVAPLGFIIVALRKKTTLSERILALLSQFQLFDEIEKQQFNDYMKLVKEKLDAINSWSELRFESFAEEAIRANLLIVSIKSYSNGCVMLLLRKRMDFVDKQNPLSNEVNKSLKVSILRISHYNKEKIADWLTKLKCYFDNNITCNKKTVWLCAVDTAQESVSGIVGMMQSLRKELGSQHLRCFYDCHTFKQCDEPIDVAQIEQSANFRRAIERDLIWNCIDSEGNFGSFRHFNINNYFNHDDCLCSNNPIDINSDDDDDELQSIDEHNSPTKYAYVDYSTRGDLSSFTWYEATALKLNSQSEHHKNNLIKVAYSALNFRDIMIATGKLPVTPLSTQSANNSDISIGLEFSGFESNGNRVMGMTCGQGIATYVLSQDKGFFKLPVPQWMSMEEAATIPVAYATAIMALKCRGKMKKGESVLIHAGSGALGQAAIRVASHYGLTIYTTVGSKAKRDFLLEHFNDCIVQDRIFNSRDCSFESLILEMTQGRGVDLVLNSLADDKLQSSIRCLADGGRFLEVGKYDLANDSKLELLRLDTNKTFHGIFLDLVLMSGEYRQLTSIMKELVYGLEIGYVKPIKHTIFKRNQIEEAFRFMATGKHIGKVLVQIEPITDIKQLEANKKTIPNSSSSINCVQKFYLSERKSYIVTGGLGGFGLELTKWLVDRGARYIILTSRTGNTNGYQKITLDRLLKDNRVKLVIVDKTTADTTTMEGVNQLCHLALDMSPSGEIGGVFHLAMVLKDILLENMSTEDFDLVCRPKVHTFDYLDQVTRKFDLNIDYFVGFSSVTSGKGNVGQANYAYANSCIERICDQRRASSLHGLAIQWGAIGDVGVAYENLGGNEVIIGGTIPQRMPSCFQALDNFLCSPFSVCLSLLPDAKNIKCNKTKSNVIEVIMNILGMKDVSSIREESNLGELGLDSLMAVEIRSLLKREFNLNLTFHDTRCMKMGKIKELAYGKNEEKNNSSTTGARAREKQKLEDVKQQKIMVEDYQQQCKDKNFDSLSRTFLNFLPSLKLPEQDFCYLNESSKVYSAHIPTSQRPIFFIPPFHGEFNELKQVCSFIKRPCIGINWTRRFINSQLMEESVKIYLDLLSSTNWTEMFNLDESETKVVDLVGYSMGATIAFELLVALENLDSKKHRTTNHLKPGKLILLDGSPQQLKRGSEIVKNIWKDVNLSLDEKVDDLLTLFVTTHEKNQNKSLKSNKIQECLSCVEVEAKISSISKLLIDELDLFNLTESGRLNSTRNCLESQILYQIQESNDKKKPQVQLGEAIKAFCWRFFIIQNYQIKYRLTSDCTLIRAEQTLLEDNYEMMDHKQDMGLDQLVNGKLSSFTFQGQHETFLLINDQEIASLINKILR